MQEITTVVLDAMGGDHAPGEMVKGAIRAAEELNTPIILQIAEVRLKTSPLHLMGPMMVQAAKEAKVDVAVHLDHGLTFETVDKALSEARTKTEDADRAECYAEFQKAFAEDPAYDLICYLDALYAGNKRISGPTDKVLWHHGAGIFWNIEDWTISE